MNRPLVEKIARAVLYEGYILYPYRPSVKNHHRWTFGGLYPRSWHEQNNSDAFLMQTQILLRGNAESRVEISVPFLHLINRTVAEFAGNDLLPRSSITIAGQTYLPWQEATERQANLGELHLADLLLAPVRKDFSFPDSRAVELLNDEQGAPRGALIRIQSQIDFAVEVSAEQLTPGLFKLTVQVENQTPLPTTQSRDDALLRSLISTHTILGITNGQFVSLTDPPTDCREFANNYKNIGTWPVLVGASDSYDTMLSSPIILPDYPQIAPESPGDLFDGTEIDEILTLRILTLTDEEKRLAAAIDPRSKDLMARTRSLAREHLMNLHGAMRHPASDTKPLYVRVGDVDLQAGSRVRLRPLGRADIFDIALDGKTATIASIEQDFENRIQLAVTVDDDPGKDLGLTGQPGHRFFFGVEEIEPLPEPAP